MKVRSLVGVAVLIVLLSARTSRADRDDDNLRRDVLMCEDAIAHAKDCCGPDAVAGLECRFLHNEDEGCGSSTVEHIDPDLYTNESGCIRERSCGELRGAICQKLAAVPRLGRRSRTTRAGAPAYPIGDAGGGHAPVCP